MPWTHFFPLLQKDLGLQNDLELKKKKKSEQKTVKMME